MSTTVRVLGYLTALGAAFGLAFAVGSAVGPLASTTAASGTHAAHPVEDQRLPGGLAVAESGYVLRLGAGRPVVGPGAPISFTIEGPDGQPVTAYDAEHGRPLHLVAVRRDLSGYQHLHPRLGDDGTWTARVDLAPGTWRLIADFRATGAPAQTLGADLSVPGRFRPAAATGTTTRDQVGDYTVAVAGDLEAGHSAGLTFTVRREGRPVTDLDPYLGTGGHLVVLREGDLAYLHVHPAGTSSHSSRAIGPDLGFVTEVPSPGRYRLFLDFRHGGAVRTAELAMTAEQSP
jgi:hypothetical protein